MSRYQHVILNTSRWESETIVEWLNYYISIGFDHAYIYCNDDDPTEMFTKLSPYIEIDNPFVTFHHLPYQGQQPACWMHFFDNHKEECEWFLFVDADEFLALKPINNIKAFMREREAFYDCIHFNWIWFGPNGFETRPSGSTLLNFTRRENEQVQMNFFTKTITRSELVDPIKIGRPPIDMLNHRWPATLSAGMRQANVLGEDMTEFFSDFPTSAERVMSNIDRRQQILNTACLYHFLFRSKADFKRRVARGTLGAYYFQPMWGALPTKAGEFENLLLALGAVEDLYLHDYWHQWTRQLSQRAWRTSIVKPAQGINLARASTPLQSSVSPWSRGDLAADARGAINGIHTGADGFHTDLEENPWWLTDLGAVFRLSEIRVFNSLKSPGMAARAYPLVIDISQDGNLWEKLFENSGYSPFGGADGHPLIVRFDLSARYIKLRLTSRDFFHLDEIEVYGACP